MKILPTVISIFDFFFVKLLSEDDLTEREKLFNRQFPQASWDVIYEAYDSIDTKATAVLQHVSIMIAAASILFSVTQSKMRTLFGIEVILYVILAMFCLRLLMEEDFLDPKEDRRNVVAKEAFLSLTTKLVFTVTILFVGTMIVEEAVLR